MARVFITGFADPLRHKAARLLSVRSNAVDRGWVPTKMDALLEACAKFSGVRLPE